jgi:mRNA-degrading endonuclease RelE of RelBE toxin-antitoxin system
MPFKLLVTRQASQDLDELEKNPAMLKRLKAIRKALAFLENNPRHPALNTHKYTSLSGPKGEEIFEAYAENKTPAAYRIFWYYGDEQSQITIIAITAHP